MGSVSEEAPWLTVLGVAADSEGVIVINTKDSE